VISITIRNPAKAGPRACGDGVWKDGLLAPNHELERDRQRQIDVLLAADRGAEPDPQCAGTNGGILTGGGGEGGGRKRVVLRKLVDRSYRAGTDGGPGRRTVRWAFGTP